MRKLKSFNIKKKSISPFSTLGLLQAAHLQQEKEEQCWLLPSSTMLATSPRWGCVGRGAKATPLMGFSCWDHTRSRGNAYPSPHTCLPCPENFLGTYIASLLFFFFLTSSLEYNCFTMVC